MRAKLTKQELISGIQSSDPDVRTQAWLSAGTVGAEVIDTLAELAEKGELEVSRAAKRAIWKIVRTVGAPGVSTRERADVVETLIGLLSHRQLGHLRRDLLWMLSEITCDECGIGAIAALLSDPDLREDARCALERIPGDESLAALKVAMDAVPDDFTMNIVQSLRARGVEVPGYPCQKLVPRP
jgi:hypothetical protein